MKALILCAGKGERLGALTKKLPKPMITINKKPVLEHLILLCKKHNIKDIAINTSYMPQKIRDYFKDGQKQGVKIKYSIEQKLLGTSGALNNFRDFFNEPFFVIYGDNITNLNLSKMADYHKSKKALATLNIYREKIIDEKTSIGCVVIGKNNKIEKIIENPDEIEKEKLKKIPLEKKFINSGVYVLNPEILKLIPKGFSDFAKDIFPKALKSGSLYGFQSDCYFREIGQMSRYLKAKQEIESGEVRLGY